MFHAVRLFTLRLLRKVFVKIKRKICYWSVPRLSRRPNNKEKKFCLFIVFTRVLTVQLLNFERRVSLIIRVTIPFATFVARHCVLCDFRRSIRKLRIFVCDTCARPSIPFPESVSLFHFHPFLIVFLSVSL